MKIILIDDEDSIRNGIETFLLSEKHQIKSFSNVGECFAYADFSEYDLIISDNKMPQTTGLEFLSRLQTQSIDIPFILITAYASIEDAVTAMKIGAEDYLTKPLNLTELKLKIEKIKIKKETERENKKLKERLLQFEFNDIIGTSKEIGDVKKIICKVAGDPGVSALICGGSGTGKELAARSIHSLSSRKDEPFIAVNCAALNEELLESELFGYVKGAFTNAFKDSTGLFQAADKGTLFLDEVSEMSPRMQAKLLRVIQEKEFQPVGSTKTISADVRLLSATNKDLRQLITEGKFREDLFYRLNVVSIFMPPLNKRKEDIPLLIAHFLCMENKRTKKNITFAPDVSEVLKNYPWKGNVRELENFIKMICVTSDRANIGLKDLPESYFAKSVISTMQWKNIWENNYQDALASAVLNFEKEYLSFHLKRNKGNITKTADAINLSRVSLHKKISSLGINTET